MYIPDPVISCFRFETPMNLFLSQIAIPKPITVKRVISTKVIQSIFWKLKDETGFLKTIIKHEYHFWLFGLCYLDTFSASRSLLSSIVLRRSGELKMPNSHLVVLFPFRFHDDVITFLDVHTLDFFCNPAGAFATSSSILNCSASSAALIFSLNECSTTKTTTFMDSTQCFCMFFQNYNISYTLFL